MREHSQAAAAAAPKPTAAKHSRGKHAHAEAAPASKSTDEACGERGALALAIIERMMVMRAALLLF